MNIILLVVQSIFVGFVVLMIASEVEEFTWGRKGLLILLIAINIFGIVVNAFQMGSKSGQIDALTGNVKYHLVTKPDSTRVWEKIP